MQGTVRRTVPGGMRHAGAYLASEPLLAVGKGHRQLAYSLVESPIPSAFATFNFCVQALYDVWARRSHGEPVPRQVRDLAAVPPECAMLRGQRMAGERACCVC